VALPARIKPAWRPLEDGPFLGQTEYRQDYPEWGNCQREKIENPSAPIAADLPFEGHT
jgi:hypothetical protein